MGHLAGKEEILKQLQKRLHRNPIGLPEHPSVYEILSILFTDKEAEVGSKFPFGVVTIEQLQKAIEMDRDELEGILKGMMKKGLVMTSKKDGETRYLLSPGMTGFFEFTFMRTSETLPMKRLADLMHTYKNTPEFVQEFFSPGTSRGRAYLYGDVFPQVKSEVLGFQEAAEYIKMAGRGSLGKCYCRHEAWHLGKNCSAPIDDICMTLGKSSDFVVEQGFARRASVNELLDTLKKAEDFGLVHIGDNVLDQTTFICNCCGCCCGFLQGITLHHLKHAVTTTQFIAKPDFNECNGCEECKDRCQIKAIRMEGDYPVVDKEFCLGCGVCAHFCPSGAMKMEEREKKIIPPKTYKESLPNNTKVFKKILTIIAVIVIITLIGYVISTTEPEYSKDNCKKYKISLSNWVGSEYYECDSIIKDDNTFYLYNDNNDKYFLMFTVGKGVTVRVYSNNCK